jgi:hypothetical protein
MATEGVETTNEWSVGMDATTLGIEEYAGTVLIPVQNSAIVVGVVSKEVSSG